MNMIRVCLAMVMTVMAAVALQMYHAPAASACSCVGYTFEEAVETSDLIAEIEVARILDNDHGDISYRVAVERVWKGEHTNNVIMRTHEQTPACGLGRARVGDSWILWATGGEGSYGASWCHLPMDVSSAEMPGRLTDYLGEPAQLEPYEDLRDSPTTPLALGAVGVLVCVGVVILLAVNRSRRT